MTQPNGQAPCHGDGCHARQMHPTGLCARCRAKTAHLRGEQVCPCCCRSLRPDDFDAGRKTCRECIARKPPRKSRKVAPRTHGSWRLASLLSDGYVCCDCRRPLAAGEPAWRPVASSGFLRRCCPACFDARLAARAA